MVYIKTRPLSSTRAIERIDDPNKPPQKIQGKEVARKYIEAMRESQEKNNTDNMYTQALEKEINHVKKTL